MYATVPIPPVRDLATRLGLEVRRDGFGPCPVCGAARRSRTDTRPPLTSGQRADGERWRCWASGCPARGGAVALLAAVRLGEVPSKGDPRWAAVYAELRDERTPQPFPRGKSISAANADRVFPTGNTPTAPVSPHGDTANRPDPASVADLWAACLPLDPEDRVEPAIPWVSMYRGLSVDGIAALDLVRVLPQKYRWPRWVPTLGMDRDAWLQVYRLAVPTFSAAGELAALRFRAVDRAAPRWTAPPGCRIEDRDGRAALVTTVRGRTRELPKALASVGVGHGAGLVMADPMGLALLRGQREDEGIQWDGRVIIVEGEPDLWAVATSSSRIQRHPEGSGSTFAAFAVEAGSWSTELAARIPDQARILVWTDLDDAGERYAAAVNASLTRRCTVLRATRPPAWDPDVVA